MQRPRTVCGSLKFSGGIDDKMDEKRTDNNGEFFLDGEESELTPIDPLVKIYHDCNDGWKVR